MEGDLSAPCSAHRRPHASGVAPLPGTRPLPRATPTLACVGGPVPPRTRRERSANARSTCHGWPLPRRARAALLSAPPRRAGGALHLAAAPPAGRLRRR
eukprot:288136-Lingulodinium_polyedra.AAC.1